MKTVVLTVVSAIISFIIAYLFTIINYNQRAAIYCGIWAAIGISIYRIFISMHTKQLN